MRCLQALVAPTWTNRDKKQDERGDIIAAAIGLRPPALRLLAQKVRVLLHTAVVYLN